MSTDYKIKYLKYKKKYLDLKSNIDQTSGSGSDKDLVLSGTFEIGEFKKNLKKGTTVDNDEYEQYFGDLFKKEEKGKPVKYEIYIRENKLKGNLKRDGKEYKLHIKFFNEGDMLNKKIYVIDKFRLYPTFNKESYVLTLNYSFVTLLGGNDAQQYENVAIFDFEAAKQKNRVNHLKKDEEISENFLFSPDTNYHLNTISRNYKGLVLEKFSDEELKESSRAYKQGIIDVIGIPEGWERKEDPDLPPEFAVYHEYQNDGVFVYGLVDQLVMKAARP